MTEQFNFELVSPDKKLISESAWQVTLPGQEGDVGVRAGHMALVVAMRPGVVEVIREENGTVEKLFVAGGFADIAQHHCTILAEQAIPVANLNTEKLEQELNNLNDDLKIADSDLQKTRLQNRQLIVQSMLDAVKAA